MKYLCTLTIIFLITYTSAQNICSKPLVFEGERYDMSGLIGKVIKAYNINDNGYSYDYELSVCGEDIQCSGKNASLCQAWDTGSVSLGKVFSISVIDHYTISVRMTGGDTIDGYPPRSTDLTISCDESTPGLELKTVTYSGKSTAYYATAVSAHACPINEGICNQPLFGFGGLYDFSGLKGKIFSASNLEDQGSTYNYKLNFCNESIPCNGGRTSLCQEGKMGSTNLGSFSSAVVSSEGTINIVLNNGDKTGSYPKKTSLVVFCDFHVPDLVLASVHYSGAPFAFNAVGYSIYACPVKSLK
eukprot:TRINITY_DN2978_c0_g1_i1.p1 TRINITY_DN2978_c0_g1~~TRINITY_DN2978_c0_g1_i1.p1  ORF type:complete len:301 (+),score=42.97 TRINITY_DN2978_c0_g1_i1:62-964(+)